jgi:hypothetical protein
MAWARLCSFERSGAIFLEFLDITESWGVQQSPIVGTEAATNHPQVSHLGLRSAPWIDSSWSMM